MNISGVETVCHIAVGERELTQGFYGGVRSRVARRRNLCLSLIYMQPYLPRNAWKAEADSITTETLLTTHLPVNQLCRRGHCCVARCGGGNANWRDAATGDSTPHNGWDSRQVAVGLWSRPRPRSKGQTRLAMGQLLRRAEGWEILGLSSTRRGLTRRSPWRKRQSQTINRRHRNDVPHGPRGEPGSA